MSKPWKLLLVLVAIAAGAWFFLRAPRAGAPSAPPANPQLAAIRGRVTSQSGSYAGTLLVLLTPTGSTRDVQGAQVAWSGQPGALSGSFEFKQMQPGDYTLELRPEDLVGLEPRKLVVQPSATPLEFLVRDSGERADLRVHVVADEDGSDLRAYRLSAAVRDGPERATVVLKTGETDAVLRGAPLGALLDLRVEMQGRQMLWTSVTAAKGREPLVLRLQSGWGAEFTVLGPQLEPLAGARVFLDDEFAGDTDSQGVLRFAQPQVPQLCRVDYKGWKMSPAGEVAPETGQFRIWQGSIQVRMEPAK